MVNELYNVTDYRLVLSGTIGAGKSTILESIAQYLRIWGYRVGCVREFIDAHHDGARKLSDWITGRISLLQFQDYIAMCHVVDNERIIDCPIKIYERSPYESAEVFCKDNYCYRHVLDQANELHVQYKIPYPFKKSVKIIDANRPLTEVFDDVKNIVDDDLKNGVNERVIYLKTDVQHSIERIKERGRVSEQAYSEQYLQNLIDGYEEMYNGQLDE